MTILGKKQMSEEDIKLNFITPVIQRGWKGHITMLMRPSVILVSIVI